MKNTKLIITAILLITFSASLAQPFGARMKGNGQYRMDKYEKLNLSDDQKDEIQELRFDHQSKMIEIRAEFKKTTLELRRLLTSSDLEKKEYLSLVEKRNNIRSKMELEKAEHRLNVLSLLTDEQKKLWNEDRIIDEGGNRKGFGRNRNSFGIKGFGARRDCRVK